MRSAWGLEAERHVDWRQRAACGPDTAEWFWFGGPGTGRFLSANNKAALALCAECPVKQTCYNDALEHPQPEAHIAGGAVWTGERARQILGLPANEYERQQRRRATWRESSRRKYARKRGASA